VSASLYSLGHGGNDAQKTMGIIAVLLFSQGVLGSEFHVPFWVVISCQAAMGLGTLFGGWRIVHTMGSRITQLKPVQGFCAENGWRDDPLPRDRARRSGLDDAHDHRRDHRRRLGATDGGGPLAVAQRIVIAWVLTLPAAGLIAAFTYTAVGWF
jgi:PiT family inorganic phosphate transporter